MGSWQGEPIISSVLDSIDKYSSPDRQTSADSLVWDNKIWPWTVTCSGKMLHYCGWQLPLTCQTYNVSGHMCPLCQVFHFMYFFLFFQYQQVLGYVFLPKLSDSGRWIVLGWRRLPVRGNTTLEKYDTGPSREENNNWKIYYVDLATAAKIDPSLIFFNGILVLCILVRPSKA